MFTSHYVWGTNGVCEYKMDVNSTWIPTWHRMDRVSWSLAIFPKPPLEGRPNTKPVDHGTPNTHNHWFIVFHHDRGPTWIKIPWNSIWLSARSHMASHYTWRSVTTLHDFGGVLGRPLDTSFPFGLSQLHGHGSWLVCEVALAFMQPPPHPNYYATGTWLGPDWTNWELLVWRLKSEDEVTPCSLSREDGHALSRAWCPTLLSKLLVFNGYSRHKTILLVLGYKICGW